MIVRVATAPAFEKTALATALFENQCTLDGDILSLPGEARWPETGASKLVVRPCYTTIWENISSKVHRRIVVSGSPGIGKSWFLFYCMYMLAKAGQPFVYIVHKGERETYRCYMYTPEGVQSTQGFTTEEVETLLSTDSNAYLLLDDHRPFSTGYVVGKIIQATSPDPQKTKEFEKEGQGAHMGGTKFYYMPVWSDDELELCRRLHGERSTAPLGKEQVANLVKIAGRIPRYLFGVPVGEDPEAWNKAQIDQALRSKSAEHMLETAGTASGDDAKISHRILAVQVTDDYQLAGLEFHSAYIRDRVWQQLTIVSQIRLWSLFCMQNGNLRGSLFEFWAHKHLASGASVCRRCLSDEASASSTLQVPAAAGRAPTFDCTWDQLTQAGSGQYLVPASGVFEAIDAVYLPYMLQMTVATEHPIKLNKFAEFLIALDERALSRGQDLSILRQQEIPFVFVVPREQMDKFK